MTDVSRQVASCDPHEGRCQICGDEAIAGRVMEIDTATRTAVVSIDGQHVTVALDLVDARVGDDLLIHMGFAIEKLEPRRPQYNEGGSLGSAQAPGIRA